MHSMIAMMARSVPQITAIPLTPFDRCRIIAMVFMADAHREDAALLDPSGGRETRIEELLLAGLDHYFHGQYELAVSVWTRVLFLDRSHARARAYIERARGAIAERQREGEELLHTGAAAFQRGDAAGARRLLNSAVERGASPDEALALLDRLDRLSPVGDVVRSSSEPRRRHAERGLPAGRRGAKALTLLLALALGVASGILVMVYWSTTTPWTGERVRAATPAYHPTEEPLPVPVAADVALARAHALYAKGHLREALTVLETIRPGDARRSRADELRIEIQHHLLDAARASAPPSAAASTTVR
jgi:hypothetical protein